VGFRLGSYDRSRPLTIDPIVRFSSFLGGAEDDSAAGIALATVLDRYRLIRIPADVYQLSHLPFTVVPRDAVLVVLAALLICFVATIYPSRQAARLDPAEALRHE